MADLIGHHLGHYRLIRHLGQGGFADVYLGEQVYLGSQAAIKVLSAPLPQDATAGFLKEARTLVRLVHPHIIRLLDYGVEEHTPYLVMEYAPGGTLRDQYLCGQQLPLSTVVEYVKQAAEALQYAHNEGLIHRDVKPANLLLGRHHEVLLSDFGIALPASSSQSQRTQDIMGTISYMAPEQIQGHPCNASDQYALGVIAYEWLTGNRPFSGSLHEIMAQHCLAVPLPLRGARRGIPRAVEAVILHTLAKRPEKRFASVKAFAATLERSAAITSRQFAPLALTGTPSESSRQWTLEDDFEGRSTR